MIFIDNLIQLFIAKVFFRMEYSKENLIKKWKWVPKEAPQMEKQLIKNKQKNKRTNKVAKNHCETM